MLWVPLVSGLAIVLTIILSQLRSLDQSWAIILSTVFAVIVLLSLIPQVGQLMELFHGIANEAKVGTMYLSPVLKTVAVAYITSFGSQICKDAEEKTIAHIVELAGKVVICIIALPVIQAILYSLFGLIS
ncbi:MAG: stage III sporulation protein AD [Firmicutes bacterium]|nr:stage III sporulation protein AD [Bacillota bacterium]